MNISKFIIVVKWRLSLCKAMRWSLDLRSSCRMLRSNGRECCFRQPNPTNNLIMMSGQLLEWRQSALVSWSLNLKLSNLVVGGTNSLLNPIHGYLYTTLIPNNFIIVIKYLIISLKSLLTHGWTLDVLIHYVKVIREVTNYYL